MFLLKSSLGAGEAEAPGFLFPSQLNLAVPPPHGWVLILLPLWLARMELRAQRSAPSPHSLSISLKPPSCGHQEKQELSVVAKKKSETSSDGSLGEELGGDQ